MYDQCHACGHTFAREGGYWLGAIYLNYAVAVGIVIALHLLLTDVFAIPIGIQLVTLIPLAVLLVLLFFRHSKALFMALDLTCDPPRAGEDQPTEEANPTP